LNKIQGLRANDIRNVANISLDVLDV
jgi:hypothetical protein